MSLSIVEISQIVGRIKYPDRRFVVTYVAPSDGGPFATVHVEYYETDVDAGELDGMLPMLQRSRRWVIEPSDGETEIVNTCFAAIQRSFMHVVAEHFTYDGCRVFSPHTSIVRRMELARR